MTRTNLIVHEISARDEVLRGASRSVQLCYCYCDIESFRLDPREPDTGN